MKSKKDISISCVVAGSNVESNMHCGKMNDPGSMPQQCSVIESARRLISLGLCAPKVDGLDTGHPMLQKMCEYARLDASGSSFDEYSADEANATLKAVMNQIQEIDLELEMLKIRKQALKRRSKALQKLIDDQESNMGFI